MTRAVDDFFAVMEAQRIALTFDDVRIQTRYASLPVSDIDIQTRFSRNIPLRAPFASAAMDTVTEYAMAIAMAERGGIGIIHRNLTPEEQAKQIAKVKHHLNARIDDPITVQENQPVEEVLAIRDEKKFRFETFPVLSSEGKLVGIVTGTDFEFWKDRGKAGTIADIMSRQVITTTQETTVEQAYTKMVEEKKKVLPVIDEAGMLKGLYIISDLRRILKGDAQPYNVDTRGQLRVGAAIGLYDDAFARAEILVAKKVDVLVIDQAHGDAKEVVETLRELKKQISVDIVVGNISQGYSVRALIEAGADGIKIGQGGGSICTTRVVAGIGCPQVTAVYRCAKAAEEIDATIPIISDGGAKHSGDIPIALVAGAHAVMMGSMFAGTEEAPGEKFTLNGRWYKNIRGMGSLGAMEESASSRQRYGQTGSILVPEGIEGIVEYKGSLETVFPQYVGGLRKGMRYAGAASIQVLREEATFDRVTPAGQKESHPHDVTITREAPNYSAGR